MKIRWNYLLLIFFCSIGIMVNIIMLVKPHPYIALNYSAIACFMFSIYGAVIQMVRGR